jgi:hypothetical protein
MPPMCVAGGHPAAITPAIWGAGEALSLRLEKRLTSHAARSPCGAAKTDAGVRAVYVLPVLRNKLGNYRARSDPAAPDALVFGTAIGHLTDRGEAALPLCVRSVVINHPAKCRESRIDL